MAAQSSDAIIFCAEIHPVLTTLSCYLHDLLIQYGVWIAIRFKNADLAVVDGDIFNAVNPIEMVLIDGRIVFEK